MSSRRNFLKKSAVSAAGISVLSGVNTFANIVGANDRINTAIIGCGGRAHGLVQAVHLSKPMVVSYISDVDSNRLEKFKTFSKEKIGYTPKAEKDFRKILEDKEVDAVVISTPEHWHAPMSIMAMQAGKHVYVEKPCSHNARETELLIEAQQKYNKVCQMGNQQRSALSSTLAYRDIQEGVIGEVYAGRAFYANTRKSIGNGKKMAPPATLDWDLWQGPAPREDYRDNIHPYNWHWFRSWGTGEIHNNGTHEIDVCRWMLGVNYPNRVVSTGGRNHFKGDDWEFFDTQTTSFEYEGGKTISWEGRSCNGYKGLGGRGVVIHGTEGSIYLNRAKYDLLDLKGNVIKTEWEKGQYSANDTADLQGFDGLTTAHMRNFADAILKGDELTAPIADAAISTQLCHLGNIAQDLQENLKIEPQSGRVVGCKRAKKLWKRKYEKGWEIKV
ncbi:Gfo/Idh/MocA family oxidoreductase [Persicobacter diffluens]|uniref:Dehydrogenase n=1 Tax=Persicobacter diffluens TaxID=981 RepID=A0AAN4W347_9BACT|nr:dehydrogenase [Persicobacter diffluens]